MCCNSGGSLLATVHCFLIKIEYKYDFLISKQLRSQTSLSSLLLTNREGYYVNYIGVTDDNLKPATRN